MSLSKGNHWRPLSGASDRSEGQEQGGGSVEGPERPHEVKLQLWFGDVILVSNQCFGVGGAASD